MVLSITGNEITAAALAQAAFPEVRVELAAPARAKMQGSRDYIEARISAGEIMYGVNTGFGAFSSVQISPQQIEELQLNLIRSHSVGLGDLFSPQQTRAIMILRANALARGHSAIRPLVVDKIIEFLNKGILPAIPKQGSVGASGDLAPLSHLALALIGEGEVLGPSGPESAAIVLKRKGVEPLRLQAKEGLSLINGCQVMTAVGLLALASLRHQLVLFDVAGAMTLEAMHGSRRAFHSLLSQVRPHPGEIRTAENLRKILAESSQISKSHVNCNKVQDCYSLRCMPAVHGSVKNIFNWALTTLEIEANSSTDNPLVFAEEKEILSCGNFHGMPVAHAMDSISLATTSLASISEQRIAKMMNPAMSELPAFLAPEGGLNSGFMIVHVAAASLVSENKVLAHPASVDSIPTSADKEDHVSMGTIAARKFSKIVANTEKVLAMELLTASQAVEFSRPLRSSDFLESIHEVIRSRVPFAKKDRVFSRDIESIVEVLPKLSDMCQEFGLQI